MAFEDLLSGAVISYPFLWSHQHNRGETEGRKPRPVAVALRLKREGGDAIVLLAITTKEPQGGRSAIEVPVAERKRAGLNPANRCWIMLDEFNTDIIGKSYYLNNDAFLGAFSKAFFLPVAQAFVAGIKSAKRVERR